MYYQQFYLKKTVFKEKFATQLKLYCTLSSRYNIDNSFFEKTGLSISDFIFFIQTIWLIVKSSTLDVTTITFYGSLTEEHIFALEHYKGKEKVQLFLKLLTLEPSIAKETISSLNQGIKNKDLKALEQTYLTRFPFEYRNNRIKIVHESTLNYAINYFLYDYLKSNDPNNFTQEFGKRFEKYVECGIKEIGYNYITENDLKKLLPDKSKAVDFIIQDKILIECKAIELKALSSINPTDEIIYNELKESIFKAYTKQMLHVANTLKANEEYFGVILTYKEIFWGDFTKLWDICKKDISENIDFSILPPENVFITDIFAWDKMVQISKNGTATMLDMLKKAKKDNSNPNTSKQLFDMHLDEYNLESFELSYLKDEISSLNAYS